MKTVERHRYKGKEIIETRRLVFEPYAYTPLNMTLVLSTIQHHLTPDLLKRKKLMYNDGTNKYYGHCYHATQALYYLMDTDQLVPMSGEDYRGEKHWWLENNGRKYDCTADQYYMVGRYPPYQNGRKSKWYGWQQRPQQVSLNLMVKVLGDKLGLDTIVRP